MIHGPPMKKCSFLNYDDYIELNKAGNNAQWYCPKCLSAFLPFAGLNDISYDLKLAGIHKMSSNTSLILHTELLTPVIILPLMMMMM